MKHLLAALSLCAGAAAWAHDTWFRPLSVQPGSVVLALGTGTRFPQYQFPIGVQFLGRSGCRSEKGEAVRLSAVRERPLDLLLQASDPSHGPGLSCWAQLAPSEIELPPDTVQIYLDEIHATAEVRQRWAAQQARGVAWKERYTKHARIELGEGEPMAQPSGMDMDLQLEGGQRAPRPGEPLVLRVLRGGQPLAGQPVELVGEQQQSAGWAVSDEEGRVRFTAPAAGRWLVRCTALRPAEGEAWESDFVTLALEVR